MTPAKSDRVRLINEEHKASLMDATTAVEAARRYMARVLNIGRLLAEEKAEIRHGEWIPWVEANLEFSRQQAAKYMRAHENRAAIEAEMERPTFHFGGLDGALKAISPPGVTSLRGAVGLLAVPEPGRASPAPTRAARPAVAGPAEPAAPAVAEPARQPDRMLVNADGPIPKPDPVERPTNTVPLGMATVLPQAEKIVHVRVQLPGEEEKDMSIRFAAQPGWQRPLMSVRSALPPASVPAEGRRAVPDRAVQDAGGRQPTGPQVAAAVAEHNGVAPSPQPPRKVTVDPSDLGTLAEALAEALDFDDGLLARLVDRLTAIRSRGRAAAG
jgi:hypothetical protein